MQLLVSKIHCEAEAALAFCKNDEEREKVFAQIENSVRDMQEKLQQKTEKIVADLKLQSKSTVKNPQPSIYKISRTLLKICPNHWTIL